MRKLLIALTAFLLPIANLAQTPARPSDPIALHLWPHGAPGTASNSEAERNATTSMDALVAGRPVIRLVNVSDPTLTLYTPKIRNTGAAIVVFPGGG